MADRWKKVASDLNLAADAVQQAAREAARIAGESDAVTKDGRVDSDYYNRPLALGAVAKYAAELSDESAKLRQRAYHAGQDR